MAIYYDKDRKEIVEFNLNRIFEMYESYNKYYHTESQLISHRKQSLEKFIEKL